MPISQPMPTPVSNTDIANRTRKFLCPFHNGIVGDVLTRSRANDVLGLVTNDNEQTQMATGFVVPNDYSSDLKVSILIIPASAGDIYISSASAKWCEVGEGSWHSTVLTGSPGAITVTTNQEQIMETTLTPLVAGDIVGVLGVRAAQNVLDTINDVVYTQGVLVEYTADM